MFAQSDLFNCQQNMKILANLANAKGNQLHQDGEYQQAIKQFEKAIKLAPNWAVPWYNLGLLYKHTKEWHLSLECNQHAVRLNANDEAAWWNLGIAATALGVWEEARRAWATYGVSIPLGDGPIELDLGLTPIRLNPKTSAEVVWCDRIDPARALIRNIPFPASGHHYGDIVLHDGEPNGYRRLGETEVPVFDALALLEASPFATYEVVVEAVNKEDRDAFMSLADVHELPMEDWSTVRMLCHLCSTGRPHAHHESQKDNNGPLGRYGIAARDDSEVTNLLEAWRNGRQGCLVLEYRCVLPVEAER